MEKITSSQNKQVKEWKKLLTRKGREKQQKYIIEGKHLIEEAKKGEALIEQILVREDKQDEFADILDKHTVIISDNVAQTLSDTVTDQGVFAVLRMNEPVDTVNWTKPLLLLDSVQGPGNMGTLIRSADAAGFGGVIIGKGSVSLYNPKVLRSAQGSPFHLPVIESDIEHWIDQLMERGKKVYGTALGEDAVSYRAIQTSNDFGLIVGNEGNGVRHDILNKTSRNLYIPIKGQAESLNVAIAASIIMFSLYR